MASTANWAEMGVSVGGTSTITLSAVASAPTFTQAFGTGTTLVDYVIVANSLRETGVASFDGTTLTLSSRSVTQSWNGSTYSTDLIDVPTVDVQVFVAPTVQTSVTVDGTQTLTNKTLTAPVIASVVSGGNTVTLPSTTDTLVGRATTDTLTNKTLTTPTIASFANAAHSHQDAGGGGTLNASAIGAGVLPMAHGGTGAALTDPGADRIQFWDDSLGAVTWLAPGTGLSISGTTLNAATPTLADGDYGDVTVSSSGAAIAIDADVVTNTKLADMAQGLIKGRAAGAGTGDPTDLTDVQVKAILGITSDGAASIADVNTGTSTTLAVTPDAAAGAYLGTKSFVIEVVPAGTDVTVADGKAYFVVPAALNGMDVVSVRARVITAGTTGATLVQLYNVTDSVDICSTGPSIASGSTAVAGGTVNSSNDALATDDLLRVDVDTASTTKAQGLFVIVEARLP